MTLASKIQKYIVADASRTAALAELQSAFFLAELPNRGSVGMDIVAGKPIFKIVGLEESECHLTFEQLQKLQEVLDENLQH